MLRDFETGTTVRLVGARAGENPLFIGAIDADGYRWLWASREAKLSGALHVSIAAGSHEAQGAKA